MAEAKIRIKNILHDELRCIYCASTPTTIEHMPPRILFFRKQRPKGFEFASCEECNNGTRGADLVASLFAHIANPEKKDDAHIESIARILPSLDKDAPGVREEVFSDLNAQEVILRKRSGLLVRSVKLRVESELAKIYLDIFSAKIGMALYRQHVGEALPLTGAVQTHWFSNVGLGEDLAFKMLAMMPEQGTLKQGAFNVKHQFSYHYNCDQKMVLMALINLHDNFYIFCLATSEPELFKLPRNMDTFTNTGALTRAGQLLIRLQKK